jgi:hypothetical protein
MAGSCQHLHYICIYVGLASLLLPLCTNGVDEGTYEHAGLGGGGIRNFLCSGWKSLPRSTTIFCTGCSSAMEWIVASLVHRLAEMVREIGGNPIYLTGTDASLFPECLILALGEGSLPRVLGWGTRGRIFIIFRLFAPFFWSHPTLFETPWSNLGLFWIFFVYFISFFSFCW